MKFFILLVLFCSLYVQARGYRVVECEPVQFQSEKQWVQKYNMTVTPTGFITSLVAWSSHKIAQPLSFVEKETGVNESYFYLTVLDLKKVGRVLGFRAHGQPIIYHFIHGDAVLFHTLNPATGEHEETEIGFHTKKYYFVVPAGVWFSIDFPDHFGVKSSLIGVTLVRGDIEDAYIKFPGREDLRKDFPKHHDIINKIYERTDN